MQKATQVCHNKKNKQSWNKTTRSRSMIEDNDGSGLQGALPQGLPPVLATRMQPHQDTEPLTCQG